MPRIRTYLSIHGNPKISATFQQLGINSSGPLILQFKRENWREGSAEVTIYTGDDALAEKLANAINRVVAEHQPVTETAQAAE